MKKNRLTGIFGGILGLVLGVIGGGFLGLVVGGTFLGGLDIHQATGLEGYELAAYAGAFLGGLAMTVVGYRLARKDPGRG